MVSSPLHQRLLEGGVRLPAPWAVVLEDIDPARIHRGVTLHPGVTLRGPGTLLGPDTELGRAGGGTFENLACGRGVALWGGSAEEAVCLSGVILRGQAELRGGTLLEEGCQGGQAVGLKMSVLLSHTALGSLINFCDVLMAGGPSREVHSEVGSCTALYNYSPQGDKWASLFGDIVGGLAGRSDPVFVGGQTQVVSPLRVGAGSAIAAGAALRRDLPAGRLHADPGPALDQAFDAALYGPLARKLEVTAEVVASLEACLAWYGAVRLPWARAGEAWEAALIEAAMRQLRAGIGERVYRLDRLVAKLGGSIERHRMLLDQAVDAEARSWHQRCLAEQGALRERWPRLRAAWERGTRSGEVGEDAAVAAAAPAPAAASEAHEAMARLASALVADRVRSDLGFHPLLAAREAEVDAALAALSQRLMARRRDLEALVAA